MYVLIFNSIQFKSKPYVTRYTILVYLVTYVARGLLHVYIIHLFRYKTLIYVCSINAHYRLLSGQFKKIRKKYFRFIQEQMYARM